jgi:signal transduction histidine kinase/FixJ family two-component response regulator
VSVRSEQVRALYQQSPLVLWANVAISVLAASALWGSASHVLLAGWVTLMVAVALGRVLLRHSYRRAALAAASPTLWARRFVVATFSAGALWGLGSLLFFDAKNPTSEILFAFAIGGMTAAAAGTWASHLPAFWGYSAASLGPLILRTLAVGDSAHWAMGAMLFAYGLGIERVARSNHGSLTRAFRLALENSELLANLSLSRERLEETNRTLEARVHERTAELERQSLALREAQRLESVGRLAGGIAHDFNNLLTIALTNVDVLKDTQKFDAIGAAAIEETLDAARRGADLTRQLLAFSRRQRLEPRVLDLNRVISDVQRLLQRIVGERVRATFALSPEPLLVLADPSQLEQVLVNLVSNARDAMPEGGTLRISSERTEATPAAEKAPGIWGLLRVEDSGVGMDADTQRQAFDPFFSTKGAGPGHGLGLATVHGIVQQSGGVVSVRSEPGIGTEFSVYLPLQAHAALPAPDPTDIAAPTPPRPATIVIAEDEPALRSGIARSLIRFGHTVLLASDGAQALTLARGHGAPIDLLITDVVMPNLGGADLARTLLAEQARTAILFISGYSWGEVLPPSDPQHRIAHLPKPFDTNALLRVVSELLVTTPEQQAERRSAEPNQDARNGSEGSLMARRV